MPIIKTYTTLHDGIYELHYNSEKKCHELYSKNHDFFLERIPHLDSMIPNPKPHRVFFHPLIGFRCISEDLDNDNQILKITFDTCPL